MGLLVDGHEAERRVAEHAGLAVDDLPLLVRPQEELFVSWFQVTVSGAELLPATRIVEDVSDEAPATLMTARYALKYLESKGAVPYVGGEADVFVKRNGLLTPHCVALNGLAIRRIAEGTSGWDVEALEKRLGVQDLDTVDETAIGILASYDEIEEATSGAGRILTYYESPYRPGPLVRLIGRVFRVPVDATRQDFLLADYGDPAMIRQEQRG